MRIVFFGTPAFAAPTLTRLLASPHTVVAAVTRPDRPRGRGRVVTASPITQLAAARGVPVLQPDRPADDRFRARIAALDADVAVVAAYGRLLPDAVLDATRHGALNVHASLLPKYRGAAPVHRAILAGERETGVTIIRLVREMDAGPMLGRRRRAIGPDETSEAVEADLAEIGADLLLATIDALAAGTAVETPQDHAAATFAPRLTRADGRLDWRAPAAAIHDRVRGLHPWPRASAWLAGARYLIHRTAVVDPLAARAGTAGRPDAARRARPAEAAAAQAGAPAPGGRRRATDTPRGGAAAPRTGAQAAGVTAPPAARAGTAARAGPGVILVAAGDRLVVAAGDGGAVAILEIQPEGRARLTTRAFLAGRRWTPGQRFDPAPP